MLLPFYKDLRAGAWDIISPPHRECKDQMNRTLRKALGTTYNTVPETVLRVPPLCLHVKTLFLAQEEWPSL